MISKNVTEEIEMYIKIAKKSGHLQVTKSSHEKNIVQ